MEAKATPAAGARLARLAALGALCLASLLGTAAAQPHPEPAQLLALQTAPVDVLTGVLRRINQSGSVKLGYREDALPFSFVPQGWRRPVGYSIDICKNIVDVISSRLDKPLTTQWVPVTAESRFDDLARGRIDLECGASSDTVQRRKRVAFSPPIFITGTRLLVPRQAVLPSLDELAGKRVGVVAGTTARQALADWLDKRGAHAELVTFNAYQAGFKALEEGAVHALLGDEVLLYALLSKEGKRGAYRLAGPWVSYDVYGIALARGDAAMQALVDDALARMAASRELENLYTRWFQRRLFQTKSLNLPMSPALRATIDMLARAASVR